MTEFIRKLDTQLSEQGEAKHVSYVDILRQEGYENGKREERRNQKLAITRRILAKNFDKNTVKEILEIFDEDAD